MRIILISTLPISRQSYGLLCLADALMQNGHKVRLVGPGGHSLVDIFTDSESREAFLEEIHQFNPDIIGISSMSQRAHHIPWLSKALKKRFPHTPLILGGIHVLYAQEQTLREAEALDFAMYGEAEETFPKLLDHLGKPNSRLEAIPGLIYRDEGLLRRNPPPEPVIFSPYLAARGLQALGPSELARVPEPLPVVVDEHFPITQPTFPILLTRGCPYRCSFCKLAGPKTHEDCVRFLPPEVFRQHLDYIIRTFNPKSLNIQDSSFDLDGNWAREICEIIKSRNEILDWFCQLRPNLVTEELLQSLVDSRCKGVNLYAESGDARVRNEILKKNVSDDQLIRAFAMVKRYGLYVRCNIIIGSPTESFAGMLESTRKALALEPDSLRALPLEAYPGTLLAESYAGALVPYNVPILNLRTMKPRPTNAHVGYIQTEVPRSLVEKLAQSINIYGHYASILVRQILQVDSKRVLILDAPHPSSSAGERLLREHLENMSPAQVVAGALWFPLLNEPETVITLLVGPETQLIPESLPAMARVIRTDSAPLELGADHAVWAQILDRGADVLVMPQLEASSEILDQVVRLASWTRVTTLAFIDLASGEVTQWDLGSKLVNRHRFSRTLKDLLGQPRSDQSIDFRT